MKKIKEYPETHQKGILSVESILNKSLSYCDFGIQIADDGRIWICVDGIAFLRFKPKDEKEVSFKESSGLC